MCSSSKAFLFFPTSIQLPTSLPLSFTATHAGTHLFSFCVLSLTVWLVNYVSALVFSASVVCSSQVGHFSSAELYKVITFTGCIPKAENEICVCPFCDTGFNPLWTGLSSTSELKPDTIWHRTHATMFAGFDRWNLSHQCCIQHCG